MIKFLISTGHNIYNYVSGDKCLLIKFDGQAVLVPYSEETTFKGLVYFALREVFPGKIFTVKTEYTDFEEGCCFEIEISEFKFQGVKKIGEVVLVKDNVVFTELENVLYKDGEEIINDFLFITDKYIMSGGGIRDFNLNSIRTLPMSFSKFYIFEDYYIYDLKKIIYSLNILTGEKKKITEGALLTYFKSKVLIQSEKYKIYDIITEEITELDLPIIHHSKISIRDQYIIHNRNVHDVTGKFICCKKGIDIIDGEFYFPKPDGVYHRDKLIYPIKNVYYISSVGNNIFLASVSIPGSLRSFDVIFDKDFKNIVENGNVIRDNEHWDNWVDTDNDYLLELGNFLI